MNMVVGPMKPQIEMVDRRIERMEDVYTTDRIARAYERGRAEEKIVNLEKHAQTALHTAP